LSKAEPLILIDPATGTPLSRLQTWLAIAVMLSGTTFVALVVTAVAPIMHKLSEHFGQGEHGNDHQRRTIHSSLRVCASRQTTPGAGPA